MKALIIDDEKKARSLLRQLLVEKCPEIVAIDEASDLEIGIKLIETFQPDIIYLDIEMPKYSGLQIIELLQGKPINFQIIFVTAYNQFAVEAFKLSAIDYLLKPIDANELQLATQKAVKLIEKQLINNQIEDLKNVFKQLALNKIALDVPSGIQFVSHDDILLFEADGMYTKVHLNNNTSELICKPLKHFANQLEALPIFYKPHRSFLVNLKHLKEFSKKDGYHLVLSNNKTIPISKHKKDEFLAVVNNIFNL